MTDRQPTYPGRVTLTPVEGQTNKYDMVMADEPTDVGTPPIKANLLSDTTSQKIFGETNNHTVNEALNAISFPQVTVTTDTGATVTATDGASTVTGTSVGTGDFGECILNLPNYGSWTITASLNGSSSSSVLLINDVKQYSLAFYTADSTLNNNSWAEISKYDSIASSIWSIGDIKTISINGAVGHTTLSSLSVDVFILGFDHNSSRDGADRIHFQIGKISGIPIALVDAQYGNSVSSTGYFSMNSSATNAGGWSSSQMYTNILGNNSTPTSPTANTLLASLPSDLRAVMKSCTKYTDNTGGGSDTANYVTATTDYLWLLSEFEYHGARTYANSAEQNYQAQYAYYQAGNSKIKYKHNATGTSAQVWCRSADSSDAYNFCRVGTDGSASYNNANYSWSVSPAFCV